LVDGGRATVSVVYDAVFCRTIGVFSLLPSVSPHYIPCADYIRGVFDRRHDAIVFFEHQYLERRYRVSNIMKNSAVKIDGRGGGRK
jgi:hypothetical protein